MSYFEKKWNYWKFITKLYLNPCRNNEHRWRTESEIISDCPTMVLWYEKKQYQLVCWDWIPGTGPGDFELNFKDEDSVVDFIESYYFGENEYFKKRLEYVLNKNKS